MKFKANEKRLEIALLENESTYQKLQKATGLSQRTINKVLSGSTVRPSTCGKIARALNVPVTELFERY